MIKNKQKCHRKHDYSLVTMVSDAYLVSPFLDVTCRAEEARRTIIMIVVFT